ncbi:carbohydrate ABC transporter permease [Halanaerobium praevalens]|uniref:Carbohydrate ABC transporter membrane protein 2, CUT1 family n=1 Tax=Halanaerobium praevalens (strain ATCC 33744 / DSM 2228 / GSL) TaxID=572479 RepID=E3DRA8_HALPG|nr:carbohydrate ABC transporter permease [Halanaerobium praevalens]ADO77014.1 carbohydrate ABC transporter membrane protein 2, CUT1 family [Halanaerobium praevalens DSM 2228]
MGKLLKKNINKTINFSSLLKTIIMLIIAMGSIFPFIFMLSSTFKLSGNVLKLPFEIIPDPFTFNNIKSLFESDYYNFGRWYFNTILMAGTSLFLKYFFVSYTAYGFAKIKFKGRDIIFLILLAGLMIPRDIMILPRYMIFKQLNLLDSMWTLILPSLVDVYFVFLLRQSFVSIPESLSEAAKIDGCSHFKIYYKIILPLSKPIISTMMLFSFVWSWNDYMSPYLYISSVDKQMLSVGIKLFAEGKIQDYGAQMAAATLALLPIILVFIFSQRYFIEGVSNSGVKG